jgi:hypothetical protein
MTIFQKDLAIHRIPATDPGKYEYQLLVMGDPCKAEISDKAYDFGLVNIQRDGSVNMEFYRNNESVPEADLLDPDTYIVPISINIS